jgi:hypothetical protein
VDVVKLALPPDIATVPIDDPPEVNVSLPVGVPPLDLTAAVNVTDDLTVDGFFDETTVVVVAVLFGWIVRDTVWALSVLPATSVL